MDEFFEFLFTLSSNASIFASVCFLSSTKNFNTSLMLSGVASKSAAGTLIPPSSISLLMSFNLPHLVPCNP
jgi:hypothetical protein